MRIISMVSISALLVALSGSAGGQQIIVEHWDEISTGYDIVTDDTSFVVFPGGNASGADLELKSVAGRFRVTTSDIDNDDIGVITYNGTAAIKLLVMVGDNIGTSRGDPAAQDWAGLGGTGVDNVFLKARLGNKLTGDVTAGEIRRIDADFGIPTGVTITQTQDHIITSVTSNKGGIGGDLILEQGSLVEWDALLDITGTLIILNGDLIKATVRGSNDLLGDIIVENGKIDTVFVQGSIGSPTDTAYIFAGADVSGLSSPADITITNILCRGNMYAHIVASKFSAYEGKFELIRANQGVVATGLIGMGLADTPRDFQGVISAYDAARYDFNFNPAANVSCIMFDDVLDSSIIEFHDQPLTPIEISSLASSSKILIGDQLQIVFNPNEPSPGIFEDSMIFIKNTLGLQGQIIINQGNGTGTWPGEFGIGGTLGAPGTEIKPTRWRR